MLIDEVLEAEYVGRHRRVTRFSDITVTGLRWGLFALDVKGSAP